ncbi:MAG: class I SAM-dependent methyltransferase [Bacteroidetes bacterium]|nr:class I SAM-dependent methyltransferase [Bacteroidota bacterium]
MKVWILKAVIQKAISFLPCEHRINFLFQKYVTKGVNLTNDLFEDKLIHCSNHLKYFRKYAPGKRDFTSLEIGTGWYPIVPIGFYLSGASTIYTIDISDLLSIERIKNTIERYEEWSKSGKLKTYLPEIDPARFERLVSLKGQLGSFGSAREALKEIHIHAIVGDARKIDLPAQSIDLLNSNNTFEHIYPGILSGILREFRRLLSADGIMSHQIDMSDHFAHLDKSITIYNFLRFSDSEWKIIDNGIQPQNRLRFSDYIKLLQDAGFQILENVSREGSLQALEAVPVSQKYKSYKPTDLAISHTLLISK